MKLENHLAMFPTVLASLTLFWFCFLCVYFERVCLFLVLTNLNAIFQRKFAITSVINIYSSRNYSCTWLMIICISHWLPNKGNPSLKPIFFLGILTLFLLNRKKSSIFSVWDLVTAACQIERNFFCHLVIT